MRRLFFLLASVLFMGCSTTTNYYAVIGTPYMLTEKNILIFPVEGIPSNQLQNSFKVLKDKLSSSFGKILYLPAVEYDLAKGGLAEFDIEENYTDIKIRQRVSDFLGVDYLLKINLEGIKPELMNDHSTYTFKIFDMYQPSATSEFKVLVKSVKEDGFHDPVSGLVYVPAKGEKEKAAMQRAAKEILKVSISDY